VTKPAKVVNITLVTVVTNVSSKILTIRNPNTLSLRRWLRMGTVDLATRFELGCGKTNVTIGETKQAGRELAMFGKTG
jgi:hypothetical protein